MNYDDLDHLNSLISEDIISEEEDCDILNDHSPNNLHRFGNNDKLNSVSESLLFVPVKDDIDIESSDSPHVCYESNSSQKSEPTQVYPKDVKQNPNLIRKVSVSSLKDVASPSTKDSKNENVMRTLKLPCSRAILPSNSTILVDSKRVEDYSMLENKINDSLLDMLQGKITKTLPETVECYQAEEKKDESLKFITIFPSKNVEKTINLMVKGKTCRSKQLLNATEMRIVSGIVNQETMFGRKSGSYKNVYYDPESDTNIRYEVHRRMLTEFNSNPSAMIYLDKKENPKSLIRKGKMKTGSDEGKLARNKIALTRFGRISRPRRHVIRDYKCLKYKSELNDEADENENTGGYSDYDIDEDHDVSDDNGGRESVKRDLYVPLEPNKRQFSSLSICPTCNKVYPGYRRMAIHFQKFPHHKDEKLLRKLLENRKEEIYYSRELCDEPLTNTGNKVYRNISASQTSPLNKKSKLANKSSPQRLRSSAVCIKELLSHFDAKEIAKYAGPVVAEAMNSWEYLLLRGERLKSGDGTLLLSLLKELKVILAQVQAMSSYALKPLTMKNQSSSNKVTIGPEDVLQHVLGVKPGTYVISDSKPWPGAPPIVKQNTTLSRVNPEKPQNIVQSTDNTTAKLFDAVVAECLRDESSDMDSNTTKLNRKISPNYQNVAVLVHKDAVTHGEATRTNKVPIFTTNDLPVSTQLMVPQLVQPVNNDDVNSPIVLDFNIFDKTQNSDPQLSRNANGLGSTSLKKNDSKAQNKPEVSNMALPMPSLTDNITEDSREPSLETNDILDFSLLE